MQDRPVSHRRPGNPSGEWLHAKSASTASRGDRLHAAGGAAFGGWPRFWWGGRCVCGVGCFCWLGLVGLGRG